jgi:lysophospholipase L1-like esterase
MLLSLAAVAITKPAILPALGKGLPPVRRQHHPVARRLPKPAARQKEVLPAPNLSFISPSADLPAAPDTATLTIPGPNGSFMVPYLQSAPDLNFSLAVSGLPKDGAVDVLLDAGTPGARGIHLEQPPWQGTFAGITYGEHTLTAQAIATAHPGTLVIAQSRLARVARGEIVAALGDSTTSGYGPQPMPFFHDWVSARDAGAPVSADGRNYPQPGGGVNPGAQPSFAVQLGEMLTQLRGHPVFVINEGWSGTTADAYLHITTSNYLKNQLSIVRPQEWLINLGVNDALVRRPAPEFGQMMRTLVSNIETQFGAQAAQIHVACPSYASQWDRYQLEAKYMGEVNALRVQRGLGPGPDLFWDFRNHPDWIQDTVHPSHTGYLATAEHWAAALSGQDTPC